jgi:hypothetical protein
MGDVEYARSDDLGQDADHVDVTLPNLKRVVKVRYLGTPEVTRLQFLPDLFGFAEMVAKFNVAEPGGEDDKLDMGAFLAENYRYQAHVAHLAVMDPDAENAVELCSVCDFEHPPSLWSPRQTERLHHADLDAITVVALRSSMAEVRGLRPFSTAETPPTTSAPAATGESTPATT